MTPREYLKKLERERECRCPVGWVAVTRNFLQGQGRDLAAMILTIITAGQFRPQDLMLVGTPARGVRIAAYRGTTRRQQRAATTQKTLRSEIVKHGLREEFCAVAHPAASYAAIRRWILSRPELEGVRIPQRLNEVRQSLGCGGAQGGLRGHGKAFIRNTRGREVAA